MNQTLHKLTIQPDNKFAEVAAGTTILEAATEAGVAITSPCGGQATCGKCRVIIKNGTLSPPTETERSILTEEQLEDGVRLACQAKLLADAVVEVPETSRALEVRILMGGAAQPVSLSPNVSKTYVDIPSQKLEESVSLFDHLKRTLKIREDLKADLSLIRQLPAVEAEWDNQVTAVAWGDKLIALEKDDTTNRRYGVALDIGTTTIVGTLIDLNTGKSVETDAAVNPQSQYGHDVISRITHTTEHEDGLETLQEIVIATVNKIIETIASKANVRTDEVYEMTVVGNSTMLHLFLGLSPRSLGLMPFVPVVSQPVDVSAAELGIRINPAGNVHALPNIAGFVGADTVGAILSANFDLKDEEADGNVKLLADMGTNCEIVLKMGDELFACSTAAGPAFEGAKIKYGMYAGPGAIEKISLNGTSAPVEYRVIGQTKPKGICGSGLVDIAAELLRTGIVDATGRMLSGDELAKVKPELRERVRENDGIKEFMITNSQSDEPISLTQRDIRELQLAKAAIRTGIEVLLKQVEKRPEDVSELYIAGGFGNYLNKENAIRLGLIPEIQHEKIKFIGNAAVAGAKMALVSMEVRERTERVAHITQHLQIAETPDFQTRFMDAMLFM